MWCGVDEANLRSHPSGNVGCHFRRHARVNSQQLLLEVVALVVLPLFVMNEHHTQPSLPPTLSRRSPVSALCSRATTEPDSGAARLHLAAPKSIGGVALKRRTRDGEISAAFNGLCWKLVSSHLVAQRHLDGRGKRKT